MLATGGVAHSCSSCWETYKLGDNTIMSIVGGSFEVELLFIFFGWRWTFLTVVATNCVIAKYKHLPVQMLLSQSFHTRWASLESTPMSRVF